MVEMFCDCQIKAAEDTEDTWTCCAHLSSGYAFRCPCSPDKIEDCEIERLDGSIFKKKRIVRADGRECIDFEPVNQEP